MSNTDRFRRSIGDPTTGCDWIAELAAAVFQVPIAAIALVTGDRMPMRSAVGLNAEAWPHAEALCAQVIDGHGPLLLRDIAGDDHLRDQPSTIGGIRLAFYAGVALTAADGRRMGTFWIADQAPRRDFSDADLDKLEAFGNVAVELLKPPPARQDAGQEPAVLPDHLSTLHHELRTPLNGVLGMAELLLASNDLGPRHRRQVAIIQRSGEALLRLLDQSFRPLSETSCRPSNPSWPSANASGPALEQASAAHDRPSASDKPGGRNVLVVEDDKDMALLIEDFLLEADHRVTIAADGAAALDALTAGRFDLVLMDGRLSDMSGIEVTARIRRLAGDGAGIPIVALTGEALDGDRERYLAAGMDGYITKPIDYDRLISTIETCCCAHSWPLAANP